MNVTVLLAHPDDELMCAGTIARFAADHRVTLATLFVDDRQPEWEACCHILKAVPAPFAIEEDDFAWTRRTVRTLETQMPKQTDLWITHRADDANTSHGHIARTVRTLARKNSASVWECDQTIPGGIVPGAPDLFVDISAYQEVKEQAIAAYESQLRRYSGLADAIGHRDKLYGWQIGTDAAEGFTVHKAVWK